MSERGVYAVDRGIWDHPDFADEPFTEREAWHWLIGSCAWEPKRVRVGHAVVDLERGQCAFSLRFMAKRWQWSEPRVRRFLNRSKTDGRAIVDSTQGTTRITICNYDKYQFGRRGADSSIDAQTDAAPTQHRRKEEEPKNLRTKDDAPDGTPAKYAFESGCIRLNAKHLDQWRKAYKNLDLEAEMLGLTQWAGTQGGNWFCAVAGALAKRNREIGIRKSAAQKGVAVTPSGNLWPEAIT